LLHGRILFALRCIAKSFSNHLFLSFFFIILLFPMFQIGIILTLFESCFLNLVCTRFSRIPYGGSTRLVTIGEQTRLKCLRTTRLFLQLLPSQ
jgi:hypothetical protein